MGRPILNQIVTGMLSRREGLEANATPSEAQKPVFQSPYCTNYLTHTRSRIIKYRMTPCGLGKLSDTSKVLTSILTLECVIPSYRETPALRSPTCSLTRQFGHVFLH